MSNTSLPATSEGDAQPKTAMGDSAPVPAALTPSIKGGNIHAHSTESPTSLGGSTAPPCDACGKTQYTSISRYCHSCHMALCPDCALDDHKDHSLFKYQTASLDYKAKIRETAEKADEELNECHMSLAILRQHRDQLKSSILETIHDYEMKNDAGSTLLGSVEHRILMLRSLYQKPLCRETYEECEKIQSAIAEMLIPAKKFSTDKNDKSLKLLKAVQEAVAGGLGDSLADNLSSNGSGVPDSGVY